MWGMDGTLLSVKKKRYCKAEYTTTCGLLQERVQAHPGLSSSEKGEKEFSLEQTKT